MMNDNSISHLFDRSETLLGREAMARLQSARVIVFGVGGVGSWCAEALVRSGIGHLTIVDSDCVEPTNVNRQLPALATTVGLPKVEVMRDHLLAVNPQADILALQQRFSLATADAFRLADYDFVVDAIDSLRDKLDLILLAARRGGPVLFSSMGAARRLDPLQVRVSEFWRIDGCPLAAKLRKSMRREQRYPERKFKCVWSAETPLAAQGVKGSMMPVTATFGLVLASLVINSLSAPSA